MSYKLPLYSLVIAQALLLQAETMSINNGWNLKGTTSGFDTSKIPTNCYSIIWTFNTTTNSWKSYSPKTTVTLEPTEGFWVKGSENNCSVDLSSNTPPTIPSTSPSTAPSSSPTPTTSPKPTVSSTPTPTPTSTVKSATPLDILDYYPMSKYSNIYKDWSQVSGYTKKDVVSHTNSKGVTHYYQVVEIPNGDIEWLEAAYLAQLSGGYLVSPETEDENTFVFNLINDDKYWFTWGSTHNYVKNGPPVGGFQVDSTATESDKSAGWMWLSGESMSYTNWCKNLDDGKLDTDPRDNTQPNDANSANGGYNQDAMFYGEITSKVPTWGDFPVRYGDKSGGEGGTYYAFIIEYNSKP